MSWRGSEIADTGRAIYSSSIYAVMSVRLRLHRHSAIPPTLLSVWADRRERYGLLNNELVLTLLHIAHFRRKRKPI